MLDFICMDLCHTRQNIHVSKNYKAKNMDTKSLNPKPSILQCNVLPLLYRSCFKSMKIHNYTCTVLTPGQIKCTVLPDV